MWSDSVGSVDFPTLGHVADWWIETHCAVPDGFRRRDPFRQYDWQFWCTANHFRVREDATFDPEHQPLNQAFTYRRTDVVAAQKALALDTPIATPSGWTTMRDVRPGEYVFDEAGRPTRVLKKSQVWQSDTYRVTFSDGSSLTACKDHQWWVERRTNKGTYVPGRVRTEDLVGNLRGPGGACRFRVPNAKPLQLPNADLPVPPYTLGAWLGDGHSDDARITGIDEGVFDRIILDGFAVTRTSISKRRQIHGLKGSLRTAGVLRNKHVPAAYLRASEKQRWALLQGLMDTDGYADARQGKCEFTTTLPALRDGVLELLASLGVKPTCYEGEASLNGRVTGPKWRINFAARSDMPVFGLERKQGRLKTPGRGHSQFEHRRIVSVERVETVPTQCLTVEAASHVFLAGREMIPTCNTGKGPWAACLLALMAVGPSEFAGWARRGDRYDCAEHGCPCGADPFEYEPGEPMGMRHPSPLIQALATSQDQVANIWRPLSAMIRFTGSPLGKLLLPREEFIRIAGANEDDPELDRIDAVTSSAQSRLGNPISGYVQDETGTHTKQNQMAGVDSAQRRGAAGMGGRGFTTTNPWDSSQQSVAQKDFEADAPDVFTFWSPPPKHLDFYDDEQRRLILDHNYAGSPHVSVDSVEAEAADMIAKGDGPLAERFFGNRVVEVSGSWIPAEAWEAAYAGVSVAA